MKKKISLAAVIVFLSLSFLISSAQPAIDNYYIVRVKGDMIANTLSTYPDFSYFDFTFKQVNNDGYTLAVYARDKDGNQLGDEITLTPLTTEVTRRFKNTEKGHLYLTLDIMQKHNVDGSEDYILTPRKCMDASGNYADYVSYRVSNKIEESTGFIPASYRGGVKKFDLNPSPPY